MEPHARFNLGLMRGQAGDTEAADRLIRQAADEGSDSARDWLREHGPQGGEKSGVGP